MNKKNLRKVAKAIEKYNRFNMNYWSTGLNTHADSLKHTCGAAGCVGGWTDAVFNLSDHGSAQTFEVLGLNYVEGRELCFPSELGSKSVWGNIIDNPYDATAAQAAQLLRGIASGEYTFVGGYHDYRDD